jgi:hypothetical protein
MVSRHQRLPWFTGLGAGARLAALDTLPESNDERFAPVGDEHLPGAFAAPVPSACSCSGQERPNLSHRTYCTLDLRAVRYERSVSSIMVRPNRDRLFVAFLRGRFRRIGFTVEDSKKVIEVLKARGLLHVTPSA